MSESVVPMNLAVWCCADSRTPLVSTPCCSSQVRYSAKSVPAVPTSSGRSPRQPRPNAMFAATPPRLITSESTRNDSATLSSLSGISCSTNLPGNVMRWSVAIDPVTAMRTAILRTAGVRSAAPSRRPRWAPRRQASVERVPAGAGAGRVRIVDREALLLDRVDEVDGGAHQVRAAHLVGHHLDAAELGHDVPVHLPLIEVQLIAQARAATWLHGDPQPQVVPALLREQAGDLRGGHVGEYDSTHLVLRGHVVLDCHGVSSRGSSGARTRWASCPCTP